ncbi:conserved hypothetical protein [Gloeothece citriformis PCC 7424]|uniref:Uncharacterized protein n=1 Tax=Gloeothece citriformis (strain PCC 7424) TaxID=65393 RepID=B7KF01_GLOC7|nr:hypothetical protein [Gloeothece citriformis]ACK70457.1 conserved hypothetical protein [Gloeothece citriformis PCC 7424]
MSLNKYQPHLLILPEDDANRQIANGFVLSLNVNYRRIQILAVADGWGKVVNIFLEDYVDEMRQFTNRNMVLLIDFDQRQDRLSYVKDKIPNDLIDRVFILGTNSNPENLKKATQKTYEQIGETLAKDCPDKKNPLWEHELLKCNQSELDRIIPVVKEFLFN